MIRDHPTAIIGNGYHGAVARALEDHASLAHDHCRLLATLLSGVRNSRMLNQSLPALPPIEAESAECAQLAHLVGDCGQQLWGRPWRAWATRQLEQLGFELVDRASAIPARGGDVLLLRGDAVLDARLVSALRDRPRTALIVDGSVIALSINQAAAADGIRLLKLGPCSPANIEALGLEALGPEKLSDDYVPGLRKREAPLAETLTAGNALQVERAMFDSAYKGVTDVVTQYLWPPMAFRVTRAFASAGISPNAVTSASLAFSVGVFACFAQGFFVAGLACGFAMAFLDTVDGKLARVTLTSSRWGNIFDHGIDLIAPPCWWFAWWLGLGEGATGLMALSVLVVLGGHIAGKLVEQAFIWSFGIKVHIWRPVDSQFRLITARRNMNLLILTPFALAGFAFAGYLAVASWVTICLGVHCVRYGVALAARRRGEAITSWLEV
jgi:phosphatidylglycerophosphate synthase